MMNYVSKIADGSPDTVMEDDAVKCAYLGRERTEGD